MAVATATMAQIRGGLKDALVEIEGLQVTGYIIGDPMLPAANVFPDEIEYDKTMGRGSDQPDMIVQVLVGLATDQGAQMRLDLMLAPSGTDSIKEAIEADGTLGGVIDDLRVTRASGYRTYRLPITQAEAIGCEWTVQLLT